MRKKGLRRLFLALAALAVILALGLWAIAVLPIAAGLRTGLAAQVLSNALEREAQILGGVEVSYGDGLSISVTDLRFARSSDTTGEDWHEVKEALITLPLRAVLDGSFAVAGVEMSGTTLYLGEATQDGPVEPGATVIDNVADIPSRFLNDPLSEHLLLHDILLIRPDKGDGWGTEIHISRFSSRASPSRKDLHLSLNAVVNDLEMSLTGQFTNPHLQPAGQKSGPFTLSAKAAGVDLTLSGELEISEQIGLITADAELTATSLGDLEDLYGLRREVEGSAKLTGKISGALDQPQGQDLALDLVLDGIADVAVKGNVRDIETGTGTDLTFQVDMAPPKPQPADAGAAPLFDVRVERFHGVIIGDRKRFFIRDFIVETNLLTGELQNVGPVTVDRITRDADGRLGLIGIHAVSGDPQKPLYAFEGNLRDTLRLRDITFDGRFNVPVSLFLEEDKPRDSALGILSGRFNLDDEGDELTVTSFQASIEETDLMALRLDTSTVERDGVTHPALGTQLEIPDFAALTTHLGLDGGAAGRAAFSGKVYYTPAAIGMTGKLDVGATALAADIVVEDKAGAPALTGTVTSSELHLKDLRTTGETVRLLAATDTGITEEHVNDVDLDSALLERLTAEVTVAIDRIAEAGKAASGFNAVIRYQDEQVRLDPFKLVFLGGTIDTKLAIDAARENPVVSANGRIDKLPFGTLLKYLGIDPAVTGTFYASFDLTGAGKTPVSLLRTLGGKSAISVWGGEVTDKAIDLAGMSATTWLFRQDGKTDTARLVCAVLPLSFKGGRGTTGRLIIETENVQLVGKGAVDLKAATIDLTFQPRPKRRELVEIVTTFAIRGPLSAPHIDVLDGGGAGRVVGEVLAAPLNLLGGIFSGDGKEQAKKKPCTLPKKSGPK